MKDLFPGHFKATSEELSQVWKEGTISFDASALLNLYRYSTATRNDYFRVMHAAKDRLWFSHQSLTEFLNNHVQVVESLDTIYDDTSNALDTWLRALPTALEQYERNHSEHSKKIATALRLTVDQQVAELNERKKTHVEALKADDVLGRLQELAEGKIGRPFSVEDRGKTFDEGARRYKAAIPPGYCDAGKPELSRRYGDWVMWKQVLTRAKEQPGPFILVTDDVKDDWWQKSGKGLIPRPELIEEFYLESKSRILIYTTGEFIREAKHHLVKSVKESSVNEAKSASPSTLTPLWESSLLDIASNPFSTSLTAKWDMPHHLRKLTDEPLWMPRMNSWVKKLSPDASMHMALRAAEHYSSMTNHGLASSLDSIALRVEASGSAGLRAMNKTTDE